MVWYLPAVSNVMHRIPWGMVVLLCLTLGLAPYSPPHVVEKLLMLGAGNLTRPIDWFDLCLHGAPWILLLAKTTTLWRKR